MRSVAETLIDNTNSVDTANLTYEDLRIIYGTHGEDRSVYEITGDEKRLIKFDYRKGFLTPIGDVDRDVWYTLAETLINRDFDGWITDSLQEWYHEYHPSCKGKEEQISRGFALKAHIHREYDREGWIYYIPWNRRYRSGALAGRLFPTVIAPCCNVAGEITNALMRMERREIYGYCPHCFQFSSLTILTDPYGIRRKMMEKEQEDAS